MDDLVQVGMVALWKSLSNYDDSVGYITITSYCYRMIRFAIIDYCRQQMAQGKLIELKWNPDYDTSGKNDDAIAECLVRMEIQQYLTPEQFDVFIGKHLHNYTYKELSQMHNKTQRQIKYTLKKAKDILREKLGGTYEHREQK